MCHQCAWWARDRFCDSTLHCAIEMQQSLTHHSIPSGGLEMGEEYHLLWRNLRLSQFCHMHSETWYWWTDSVILLLIWLGRSMQQRRHFMFTLAFMHLSSSEKSYMYMYSSIGHLLPCVTQNYWWTGSFLCLFSKYYTSLLYTIVII